MLYRRRRTRNALPTGYLRFEGKERNLTGFINGDYVRLKDEFGNVWQGMADLRIHLSLSVSSCEDFFVKRLGFGLSIESLN